MTVLIFHLIDQAPINGYIVILAGSLFFRLRDPTDILNQGVSSPPGGYDPNAIAVTAASASANYAGNYTAQNPQQVANAASRVAAAAAANPSAGSGYGPGTGSSGGYNGAFNDNPFYS